MRDSLIRTNRQTCREFMLYEMWSLYQIFRVLFVMTLVFFLLTMYFASVNFSIPIIVHVNPITGNANISLHIARLYS